MDSTIVGSIIGAVSLIAATVLAAFLPHYLKNKKFNVSKEEKELSRATTSTENTIKLKTWAGRKDFEYSGSVEDGTELYIGESGDKIRVTSETYNNIILNFSGQTIEVGSVQDSTSKPGTLDEWLKVNVTGIMISTYVASILKHEKYVVNAKGKIKFNA